MKALLASFVQTCFRILRRVPEENEFLGYEAFTQLTASPVSVETADEGAEILRNR